MRVIPVLMMAVLATLIALSPATTAPAPATVDASYAPVSLQTNECPPPTAVSGVGIVCSNAPAGACNNLCKPFRPDDPLSICVNCHHSAMDAVPGGEG